MIAGFPLLVTEGAFASLYTNLTTSSERASLQWEISIHSLADSHNCGRINEMHSSMHDAMASSGSEPVAKFPHEPVSTEVHLYHRITIASDAKCGHKNRQIADHWRNILNITT